MVIQIFIKEKNKKKYNKKFTEYFCNFFPLYKRKRLNYNSTLTFEEKVYL